MKQAKQYSGNIMEDVKKALQQISHTLYQIERVQEGLLDELVSNRQEREKLVQYLQNRTSVPLPIVIILFITLFTYTVADKVANRNIVIEANIPGANIITKGTQ